MDVKRHILLALASWAIAPQPHAQATAAIVKLNSNGQHYLYSAKKISRGDKIHVQFPKDGQPACCLSVDQRAASLLSADPDAVEFNSARPLYRYRLDIKGISPSLPFIGIAALGRTAQAEADGQWRLKLRTGATSADLSICTSREGVHVQGRTGTHLQDHLYLYLGYDLDDPTCNEDGSLR